MNSNFFEQIILFCALLVGLFFLQKFARPELKKQLMKRRSELIVARLSTQKEFKHCRQQYEQANIDYFANFEKKVKWMEDAELLFTNKTEQLREKHEKFLEELEHQYLIRKQKIEMENNEKLIEDMMNEFENRFKPYIDQIDLVKLLEK
jgi:hypothetical protein